MTLVLACTQLLKAVFRVSGQRKVDEWSVMTLYNDVKHFENQKKEKEVKLQEKAKTREQLQNQIDMRKKLRDEQREAERKAADEQQKRYDAWVQEKQVLQQRKLEKMAEERTKAALARDAAARELKGDGAVVNFSSSMDGAGEQAEQQENDQQQRERRDDY